MSLDLPRITVDEARDMGVDVILMPKTATTTLSWWLGVPHRHIPARDVVMPGRRLLAAVVRPRDKWTLSFARHLLRWSTESLWVQRALVSIAGSPHPPLPVLVEGLYNYPAVPRIPFGQCRITTPEPGWKYSRAREFFGPLRRRPRRTAYEAHCDYYWRSAGGRLLIDYTIPWSEVEKAPVHLNSGGISC